MDIPLSTNGMATSGLSESMRFLQASVHILTMLRLSKCLEWGPSSERRRETSSYSPVQSASWSNRMLPIVEWIRAKVPASARNPWASRASRTSQADSRSSMAEVRYSIMYRTHPRLT